MTSLTITASGQISLGRDDLRHLGLQPGSQIELAHLPGGKLLLQPVVIEKKMTESAVPQKGIARFIHSLEGKVNLKKPLSIEEINEIIEDGWAGKLKQE